MVSEREKSPQPNNTPLSQTRRSALKKMLVGTGVAAGAVALPGKWVKPVVDKVLIPAHAQTSPPRGGADEFEGGSGQPKMRTLTEDENQKFIIGKVLGGIAYLQFVSRCPLFGCYTKKMQSKTYSGSAQPAIQTMYHYQYKADAPVGGIWVNVKFVSPAGTKCPNPGYLEGNARVLDYKPGKLLKVEIWGRPYDLEPVNLAALPALTGCDQV